MAVELERTNNVPIYGDSNLDGDIQRWLLTLVDSLNTTINEIEVSLNTIAQSFTAAEITALASNLEDGVLLYDTTNDVYVGRENGAMRQFTTAAWP